MALRDAARHRHILRIRQQDSLESCYPVAFVLSAIRQALILLDPVSPKVQDQVKQLRLFQLKWQARTLQSLSRVEFDSLWLCFSSLMETAGPYNLVIDGLDECDFATGEVSAQRFISGLVALRESQDARILIFSRPHPTLLSSIGQGYLGVRIPGRSRS